jgi:pyruvate/2-oxoglutarate/acetoin dehydrogenase E1 component
MSEPGSTTELSYIQSVNAALHWSLDALPEAVIFGEDVARPGGPFGATKGLHKEFGDSRIFDTPISEQAFMGMALGMAMTGQRPIVEIMYADFLFVAMDQLINQIANTRYVSNGRASVPLVIRTQMGYSPGACAQHSHSIESYVAHTPGLRLAVPSTPEDAYGMLRTAIASDDPVVVCEARMLYPLKGAVRLDAEIDPMGGARTVREGSDVTIVSWSRMVHVACQAAESLATEGISAEVIDLRWLNPLDMDSVNRSIAKTGRLVVTHEANRTVGFGAEIAARAAETCHEVLLAPVQRVAFPDAPMPAAPTLQVALLPNRESVVEACRVTMRDWSRRLPA